MPLSSTPDATHAWAGKNFYQQHLESWFASFWASLCPEWLDLNFVPPGSSDCARCCTRCITTC